MRRMPKIDDNETIAEFASRLSTIYSGITTVDEKRNKGQIFTPELISSFMAGN